MKRFVLSIIIIYGCSSPIYNQKNIAFTEKAEKKKEQSISRPVDEAVTDATDVHYTGKYCTECHEQVPRNGDNFLKYGGNNKQLCSCHYKATRRDIHPADIEPSKEIKARMTDDFPIRNGKIVCITCHDVSVQCRDSKTDDMFTERQMFLRGAPYRKKINFCFKCHNKANFMKQNPHNQLSDKGDIVESKCLYCHTEKPDEKTESYEQVKLIGNLKMLCVGCHSIAAKQSLHTRHLRSPSAEVLASMKQMEAELGIILPLNEDGKITCVTCHNPHEKGVISTERVGGKGAGEIHRHRLSGNMCIKCHQMR